MLVYIVSVGPVGLKELANISLQRAHSLKDRLTAIEGIESPFEQPFFSEFVIKTSQPVAQVLDQLKELGVFGRHRSFFLLSGTEESFARLGNRDEFA